MDTLLHRVPSHLSELVVGVPEGMDLYAQCDQILVQLQATWALHIVDHLRGGRLCDTPHLANGHTSILDESVGGSGLLPSNERSLANT